MKFTTNYQIRVIKHQIQATLKLIADGVISFIDQLIILEGKLDDMMQSLNVLGENVIQGFPFSLVVTEHHQILKDIWVEYARFRVGSKGDSGKYQIKGFGVATKLEKFCYFMSESRGKKLYCFDMCHDIWATDKEHAYNEAIKHGTTLQIV